MDKDVTVTIYVDNIDKNFTVSGKFIFPESGSWETPPDGGYFDEISEIILEDGDEDVSDICENLYIRNSIGEIQSLYDYITYLADCKACEMYSNGEL